MQHSVKLNIVVKSFTAEMREATSQKEVMCKLRQHVLVRWKWPRKQLPDFETKLTDQT